MEHQVISRAQAVILGMNHYFTGVPCVHGHIDRRRVKTHECIRCKALAKQEKKKRRTKKALGLPDGRSSRFVGPKKPKTKQVQIRNYTPTYVSWKSARARCNNPRAWNYHNYGGRGITMCERWNEYKNFLADMGERPDGMTLDRYPDPDGNYEPGNCRWATPREQRGNQRKSV